MAVADINLTPVSDPVAGSATFAAVTPLTVTAAVPAGDTVVVAYEAKGVGTDTHTITDSRSNTYTIHARSGTVDLMTIIATSKLTTPLAAGDTITVTGSTSRQKRSTIALRAVGANGVDVVTPDGLSSTTAAASVTVGPTTQAGGLAVGVMGFFSNSGAITWPGMTGGSFVTTQQGTTDRTLAWAWQKNVAAGASVTFAPSVAAAGFAWTGVAIILKSAPAATTTFNPSGTAVVTGTVSVSGAASVTTALGDGDPNSYIVMSPGSVVIQPLESKALPPDKTGWKLNVDTNFQGSGTMTVDLLEGSTVRASWPVTLSATPTAFALDISPTQASSLTSGTSLSMRYTVGA